MGKCSYFITFALLLVAMTAQAQKAERDYIRKGNRLFADSTFVDAEVNYRKALDVNPKSTVSMYNLANTLLAQNKVEEAMQQYVAASKLEKDKGNLAQNHQATTQPLLFPEIVELTQDDLSTLEQLLPELSSVGFGVEQFSPAASNSGIPTASGINASSAVTKFSGNVLKICSNPFSTNSFDII